MLGPGFVWLHFKLPHRPIWIRLRALHSAAYKFKLHPIVYVKRSNAPPIYLY